MGEQTTGMNTKEFVEQLDVFENFSEALPMQGYMPLPDDWYIAVTDVVKSREAIAQGRFKPVNMAGAAMISAIMNELGHQQIPYIFAGDGAAVACSPAEHDLVKAALQQTVGWVADDLDLELRAAIIPVSQLRAMGSDILISAVRVSNAVTNFGFSGGGVSEAEALMKAGKFRVERLAGSKKPNLNGLSCRWTAIGEEGATIVSLIVESAEGKADVPQFIYSEIMAVVKGNSPDGNPMPENGPGFSWPTRTANLENRATGESIFSIHLVTLIALFLFKTGIKLGGFDARKYWKETSLNTDFRKIQDGLRMTVSMHDAELKLLREKLVEFRKSGDIKFGICEQEKAVLTCYVPSITDEEHFHFLDGAGGGYAAAAEALA